MILLPVIFNLLHNLPIIIFLLHTLWHAALLWVTTDLLMKDLSELELDIIAASNQINLIHRLRKWVRERPVKPISFGLLRCLFVLLDWLCWPRGSISLILFLLSL